MYKSGRVYEGEWCNNKRHGRGYDKFSNGNRMDTQMVKESIRGRMGRFMMESGIWQRSMEMVYGKVL